MEPSYRIPKSWVHLFLVSCVLAFTIGVLASIARLAYKAHEAAPIVEKEGNGCMLICCVGGCYVQDRPDYAESRAVPHGGRGASGEGEPDSGGTPNRDIR